MEGRENMYRYHPYILAARAALRRILSVRADTEACSLLVNWSQPLALIRVRRGSYNSSQLPVLGHKDPRKGPSCSQSLFTPNAAQS